MFHAALGVVVGLIVGGCVGIAVADVPGLHGAVGRIAGCIAAGVIAGAIVGAIKGTRKINEDLEASNTRGLEMAQQGTHEDSLVVSELRRQTELLAGLKSRATLIGVTVIITCVASVTAAVFSTLLFCARQFLW
jgi:hypothetical protein